MLWKVVLEVLLDKYRKRDYFILRQIQDLHIQEIDQILDLLLVFFRMISYESMAYKFDESSEQCDAD